MTSTQPDNFMFWEFMEFVELYSPPPLEFVLFELYRGGSIEFSN